MDETEHPYWVKVRASGTVWSVVQLLKPLRCVSCIRVLKTRRKGK